MLRKLGLLAAVALTLGVSTIASAQHYYRTHRYVAARPYYRGYYPRTRVFVRGGYAPYRYAYSTPYPYDYDYDYNDYAYAPTPYYYGPSVSFGLGFGFGGGFRGHDRDFHRGGFGGGRGFSGGRSFGGGRSSGGRRMR